MANPLAVRFYSAFFPLVSTFRSVPPFLSTNSWVGSLCLEPVRLVLRDARELETLSMISGMVDSLSSLLLSSSCLFPDLSARLFCPIGFWSKGSIFGFRRGDNGSDVIELWGYFSETSSGGCYDGLLFCSSYLSCFLVETLVPLFYPLPWTSDDPLFSFSWRMPISDFYSCWSSMLYFS